ncbi:hypothetical protein NJ75_04104 [Novosphingobium subterraneum]|uniref:Uncharacterized protein n=1 Tax=Novosphingobium subterraneum TaxID=48936 RepID=A0A0B8Z8Y5_9SPHN|nr:hypothetical protein NJ75_04104 [Novosphingobium subterraneum]
MEGTVTASLFFIVFGGFLTFTAILNWRHRREEKINLLEAAILKVAGTEPLPLTRLDRILQTFHIIMASIFGPFLLFLGIAMMVDQLGIIP